MSGRNNTMTWCGGTPQGIFAELADGYDRLFQRGGGKREGVVGVRKGGDSVFA
jgi:hypothetical protein